MFLRLSLKTRRVVFARCSSVARSGSDCFFPTVFFIYHTAFYSPRSHHTHSTHARTLSSLAERSPALPTVLPPSTPFTGFPALRLSRQHHLWDTQSTIPVHTRALPASTPEPTPLLKSNNIPQTCAVRLIGSERSSPTTRCVYLDRLP